MARVSDGGGRLDETDRALLVALQADCKQSLAELGAKVRLSPPAVLERVRRLEESGVVRGYHAQLDARRVGLDIGAFIGVGIDHPRSITKFESAVAKIPEVLESHHVTGRHTLLLKIRTANTESLHHLIGAIRELPGVARTETMIVLQTQLERQEIAIPPAPDDAPRARRGRARTEGGEAR